MTVAKHICSAPGTSLSKNQVLANKVLGGCVNGLGEADYRGSRGFVCDGLREQLAELTALSQSVRADAKPVHHVMFSFQVGEHPSPAQIEAVIDELTCTLGLSRSHQILYAMNRNRDTKNDRLHVMLNAVDPDSERVTPIQFMYDRLAETCLKIERDHGFSPEPNRRLTLHGISKSSGDGYEFHHEGRPLGRLYKKR